MAFLGGMYVFPGGNVRKEDCAAKIIARCQGLSANQARKILGAHLTPSLALAHWIAGVRELYEEAGILLARHEDGRPVAIEPLHGQREALLAGNSSFLTLLESGNFFCDLRRMIYFSRWETPRQVPIRFDTRFYLAPLPEGQTPVPHSQEVEGSLWLTPDRALALFKREELPMIFPTFASLRTLADFETMESVLKEYQSLESRV
jgi:8-oxo-dGTP pyrophosphatase MutT (NUDIX family)